MEQIVKQYPKARIRYQEHGSDPRNYRVDFAKIRDRLHFEPSHTIADGIAELSAALEQGKFDNVDSRPNFHRNVTIDYP